MSCLTRWHSFLVLLRLLTNVHRHALPTSSTFASLTPVGKLPQRPASWCTKHLIRRDDVGGFGLTIWVTENVSDSCTKRFASRDHKTVSHAGRCHPSSYDNSSPRLESGYRTLIWASLPHLCAQSFALHYTEALKGIMYGMAIKESLLSNTAVPFLSQSQSWRQVSLGSLRRLPRKLCYRK